MNVNFTIKAMSGRFSKIAICASCGILFAYFLFVLLIVRPMPLNWSKALGDSTFGQIYHVLGRPQLDMSAKEYQQWIIYYPWGRKVLEIASSDCCKESGRPSYILYSVYLNGKYSPIYQDFIFEAPVH